MTRISLTDTTHNVLISMAEGNPGALSVCLQLFQDAPRIDPDNKLAGLGYLLNLDTLGIYGPRIWMLYKDVCGQDLTKTCAILRAWQLGNIRQSEILHAIDNYGDGIDVDLVLEVVQVTLPAFGQADNDS